MAYLSKRAMAPTADVDLDGVDVIGRLEEWRSGIKVAEEEMAVVI